jgi:hypothetical protein
MSKYGNRKITVDGITFDSKKEACRYRELKLLERGGLIQNLLLQVPFVLFDKSEHGRKIVYRADFVYEEKGETVVEDVKGFKTEAYKLKKRHMAERYDIVIREV